MWTFKPEWRLLAGSYGMDLAVRDAMKCRQLMESDWYQREFKPQWKLCGKQNQKKYYRNTMSGERVAVSVGGRVTGFRGNCVVGETLISTDAGLMPVAELVSLPHFPRVLSYNHDTNRLEWRRVLASRESQTDALYEIHNRARQHHLRHRRAPFLRLWTRLHDGARFTARRQAYCGAPVARIRTVRDAEAK
jgi:hypothetical protein